MRNLNRKIFIKLAIAKALVVGLMILFVNASTVFSQESDVFPIPKTYQVEGIPVIKNSEVAELFYDPSAIRSNLIWDTDLKNRRLLVTDEKNSVYLLDSPMAKPVRLTEGFVPNKVKVRPDGLGFAYTSDQEDEDNYQLYFYDFKEKTPKKLTTLTGKDESVESYTWSQSNNSLFYTKVDYDTKTSKLCQNNLS